MADVRLNSILITSDREHDQRSGECGRETLKFSGISLEPRMGSLADDAISGRLFG